MSDALNKKEKVDYFIIRLQEKNKSQISTMENTDKVVYMDKMSIT